MSAGYLPGTRLVLAFSAVDATTVEASFGGRGRKFGVPLAGGDAQAVRVAVQLVRDAGPEEGHARQGEGVRPIEGRHHPFPDRADASLARGVQALHHGGLDVGGDLAVDDALEGLDVDSER